MSLTVNGKCKLKKDEVFDYIAAWLAVLGLVFLQKAFDSVFHNILLTNLEYNRIRGAANILIISFLNRTNYSFIND